MCFAIDRASLEHVRTHARTHARSAHTDFCRAFLKYLHSGAEGGDGRARHGSERAAQVTVNRRDGQGC